MKIQGQFLLKVWIFTIFIFIIITSPLHADGTTERTDNSDALASIDRDIAAKNEKYNKGLEIYNSLDPMLINLFEKANTLKDAEEALDVLAIKFRNTQLNNNAKTLMTLGLAVAQLGSALSPGKAIIDGALTAFSLFIVDPTMGKMSNWMKEGNPMESQKANAPAYANGTYPSRNRLEFQLNEKPKDNAGILYRGEQIISLAEKGRDEVYNIRQEMISSYRKVKGIRESMKGQLESLRHEIKTLQRHRKFVAGEETLINIDFPEPIGIKDSDAGSDYGIPSNAVLTALVGRIADLDLEINAAEKNLLAKIKEIVEYTSSAIQQMKINYEKRSKKIYQNISGTAQITLEELNSTKGCEGPYNCSYNEGISGAEKYHYAYLADMKESIKYLGDLAPVYDSARDELKNISEIKLLQKLYGIRVSLVKRYNVLCPPGSVFYPEFRDKVSSRGNRFGNVTIALQEMARQQVFWLRQTSYKKSALDDYERDYPENRKQLVSMAKTCLTNLKLSAEYQLGEAKLALRAEQRYIATTDKLLSYLKSLVGQQILIAVSDESEVTGYAVSDEWLAAQLEGTDGGACLGLEKILQQLSIPAKRVELLNDDVKSAFEKFRATLVSLGSSNIIKSNLPNLHLRIMALAAKMAANKSKLRRADVIRHQGYYLNLPKIVDLLKKGHLDMLRKSMPLFTLAETKKKEIQKKEILAQTSLLTSFNAIVQSRLSSERIPSTAIGEYKKMLKDYKKRYTMHLGCLGDDHVYNRKIVGLFAAIEKAIEELRGKPTYLDAGKQIATLEILKDTAINLSFGNDEQYKKQVEYIEEAYLVHNYWFKKNKPQMSDTQGRLMTKPLREIQQVLLAHREHLLSISANDNIEIIIAFYDAFKQAYEAKNESQVMSFIADDWTAAGGVSLFDLEDNLRNMYNVFDDIQYSISGLSINHQAGQNIYNVSYSVTIRGVIFDNDLIHEEVSSVREQIRIDGNGKPEIYKTLGGNYWSSQ